MIRLRPARAARRLALLFALVSAAMVSLFALPALAAEEVEATGFGTGQWDGLILAAVAGIVMGLVVFAMSRPGDIHRTDDHH